MIYQERHSELIFFAGLASGNSVTSLKLLYAVAHSLLLSVITFSSPLGFLRLSAPSSVNLLLCFLNDFPTSLA